MITGFTSSADGKTKSVRQGKGMQSCLRIVGNKELLCAFRRSGCRFLLFGFESLDFGLFTAGHHRHGAAIE